MATFTGSTTTAHACEWVFLVEALIGADATLEAIADGFESMRGEPRDVFALRFKSGVTIRGRLSALAREAREEARAKARGVSQDADLEEGRIGA